MAREPPSMIRRNESSLRRTWPFAGLEAGLARGIGAQHLLYRARVASHGRLRAGGQWLAGDDQRQFVGVEHLALQQRLRNALQGVAVSVEDIEGRLVGSINEMAHLGVDFARGLLGVVAVLAELAAQEDLLLLLPEGERAELAHAPLADHLARDIRSE